MIWATLWVRATHRVSQMDQESENNLIICIGKLGQAMSSMGALLCSIVPDNANMRAEAGRCAGKLEDALSYFRKINGNG